MAKKITVTLVDDIDGKPAAESIELRLDGVVYEIDLSSKNAAKLRGDLAVWIEHARKVVGDHARRTRAR